MTSMRIAAHYINIMHAFIVHCNKFKFSLIGVKSDIYSHCKTPGINQVLTNAYLKSQALYVLRDSWMKLDNLTDMKCMLVSR
ncbi:hypothetical protein SAMN05216175_105195 [Neptunomonas qingdaonensis]|uniref:Uncharacterized protein n=1 Tax=Neptunomonas qingdaonensis TaxID=1045558 RepID=A0A1I2QZF9_9GAMM|nr:hypothetical protein SAMN05216175_105195 [Neptunomonas qingdaonensis]